jgi:hypothetical protein
MDLCEVKDLKDLTNWKIQLTNYLIGNDINSDKINNYLKLNPNIIRLCAFEIRESTKHIIEEYFNNSGEKLDKVEDIVKWIEKHTNNRKCKKLDKVEDIV